MREYPIVIEQSKNKNSRATIRHGTLVIRLARGLNEGTKREHIDELIRRSKKMMVKDHERSVIEPFSPYFAGNSQDFVVEPVYGNIIFFYIKSGIKLSAQKVPNGWEVTRSKTISDVTLKNLLWKLVSKSLEAEVSKLVHSINERTTKAKFQSVDIKMMRSRWGSCSSHGKIALSTPLFFTSFSLVQYVIIHELAHRIHHNHSSSFWKLVESHCADYVQRDKALRQFTLDNRHMMDLF